jgi:predicted permease
MPSYWQLLLLVAPVFAIIGVGVFVRRLGWMNGDAETGLIKLVVNICYPALIFESVANNMALRSPGNLVLPPLVGFVVTVIGIRAGLVVAKLIGLEIGTGQRTFALSAGVTNYAYLPLAIMTGVWGVESTGVLLVHNVGVEAAIWTVGLLVLTGLSFREGWRRVFSPIVIALIAAVIANLTGLPPHLPKIVTEIIHGLGVCGIPMGLVMTGVNLGNYLHNPRELFSPRVTIAANLLRMGVLPIALLVLARYLPCSIELKRVIVVQAAMPAAVIPILMARLYGGHPRTAVQIVLTTTALGILVIPLWLRVGLSWIAP